VTARLTNDEAVERALAGLGGRAGEVFLRESTSGSVEVRDGELETLTSHGERGLSILVLDEARAGHASTSDLTPAGIAACAEAAAAMARVTEADGDLSLASEPLAPVDLAIHEDGVAARPVADRVAVALAVERAARAVDPRISGFRKTSYGDGDVTTVFASTRGARGSYRETHFSVGTSAMATAGAERQIGYAGAATRRFAGLDPVAVGRRAAQVALGKLGARPFGTQRIAVLLDPWQGMALLGAIGQLFSADAVLKGKSLFAGKVGARVASALVTLTDDARLPGGVRTAPFDGEGTATTARTLVRDGVLEGYLTDRKTARRLGIAPGGSARRGGYATPARIGTSNLALAAGTGDPAALARSVDRALRITSLLNLHTIDPISGEFSLGATGDVLERGEKTQAVRGITIAGNLTTLLSSIVALGSDLTWGPGGIGSPTLLIGELSVGGT